MNKQLPLTQESISHMLSALEADLAKTRQTTTRYREAAVKQRRELYETESGLKRCEKHLEQLESLIKDLRVIQG